MDNINNNIVTPLLQQYYQTKQQITDRDLLLFQVGDFFETFGADAENFASIARITLTSKNSVAMAGVPIRQYNKYLKQLLHAGYNIVLAEQTAAPADDKNVNKSKLFSRSITKKITWGTWIEEENDDYRFVLAIIVVDNCYYAVYGDCKTQEGFFEEIVPTYLQSFINRINPVYIISNLNILEQIYGLNHDYMLSEQYGKVFIEIKDFQPLEQQAYKILLQNWLEEYFKTCGFNVQLTLITIKKQKMFLGANVLKNLEILDNFNHNGNSLIRFLNHTQSPMGYRVLKQQLSLPSANIDLIQSYWNSVEAFMEYDKLDCHIADISRLVHCGCNSKTMYKLAQAIQKSLNLLDKTISVLPKSLHYQIAQVQKLKVHQVILSVINPQAQVGEGIFNNSPQLEQLSSLYHTTLKQMFNFTNNNNINGVIKYNNLLGYFIETKTKLTNQFILKQGLVKVNRYTHPDLIQLESKLSLIKQDIQEREADLLQELHDQIQIEKPLIIQLSYLVGVCDYLYSNSIVARQYDYSCPIINKKGLKLLNGRHPLLDDKLDVFVTNTVDLQNKRNLIITGPNMGGKSTLLKTVGLHVIMAQSGMFVPGQLELPIFHEIFVRIGAHDNLTHGESTFMVEMKECAEIMQLANASSLVLIDELGRGTAIKDGLSLAVVISLELLQNNKSTNIIATHYHELAHYFNKHYSQYFLIYHVLVQKNRILYKLVPGVAQSSFGLLVAKMAGLSSKLIEKAQNVFNNIDLTLQFNNN